MSTIHKNGEAIYKKDNPCAKCGNTLNKTNLVIDPMRGGMAMMRTCPNCGNIWQERPLDSVEGD